LPCRRRRADRTPASARPRQRKPRVQKDNDASSTAAARDVASESREEDVAGESREEHGNGAAAGTDGAAFWAAAWGARTQWGNWSWPWAHGSGARQRRRRALPPRRCRPTPLSQAVVAAATKADGHARAVCGDHQASWSMGASTELSPELELLVRW
jgi:hypothetical protein